jgi:hypothetical protein
VLLPQVSGPSGSIFGEATVFAILELPKACVPSWQFSGLVERENDHVSGVKPIQAGGVLLYGTSVTGILAGIAHCRC